ncbi:MAG: hypothetical protein Pg6C_07690 [Treponemataceae bacterium]|nr:MAG: hypothetical protein Pg6C_07690 [Treponemataceae bacterium]
MKIKNQFYILMAGIVILPVLSFIGTGIYFRMFTDFNKHKEMFEEIMRMAESAGIEIPPLARIGPSLGIFIVILFVIGMSVFILRSISRSITMLEDSARRIAEGEAEPAADIKGSNEITSLTNALNKMKNALKEQERRRYLFIMGVTHDLKTPLALIKANVEAIEDGIAATPDEQNHLFRVVNNKVDELEGMINGLLDFVRMDSHEMMRNARPEKLLPFLVAFVSRVTLDAELLRRTVESDIDLPADLAVTMDSSLVQRALDNIVTNCFRYTPEGSRVFIAAEREGRAVKISISDNGSGIRENDLPYVFDLFYRGSASRGEQGMGMGLAVVKSIIDSHGWRVTATSGGAGRFAHGGACFCITIPESCEL